MTMTNTLKTSIAVLGALAALIAFPAFAATPLDGALGMQPAATPLSEEVHRFHNLILLPVITFISLLVLALLIWIVIRYNKKSNPVPRRFSHNTMVEVIWTVLPIIILVIIAFPSFGLLDKEGNLPDGLAVEYVSDGAETDYVFENDFPQDRRVASRRHLDVYVTAPGGTRTRLAQNQYDVDGLRQPEVLVSLNSAPAAGSEIEIVGGRTRTGLGPFLDFGFVSFGADNSEIATRPTLTIKATGYQWGWNYAYPDFGDFELDALVEQKENLDDPSLYLLAATNNIVVPEGETVRIITTGRDVIHSWAMPAFSLKIDAVPGRLNETWFEAPTAGMYYGQCSEMCGKDHAFMPIALEVMPRAEFEAWVDEQRALAGMDPYFDTETRLADAAESGDAAQ